jgi:hypothetical protein
MIVITSVEYAQAHGAWMTALTGWGSPVKARLPIQPKADQSRFGFHGTCKRARWTSCSVRCGGGGRTQGHPAPASKVGDAGRHRTFSQATDQKNG